MATALEQEYRYLNPSVLEAGALRLATSSAASAGTGAHPHFFDAPLAHAEQTAVALLVVARVARTRFYVPPGMLAAVLRAADPVVTSNGDRLRFESFSACCGVYARLDALPGTLTAPALTTGTTNVDVNTPLREALARVGPGEALHLQVGTDVAVTTSAGTVVEKKVPLPERWLKGFAEVQVAAAGTAPLLEVDAAEARRFIRSLPRGSGTRTPVSWAVPAGRGLRLATRPAAGAVCVAGPERLQVLEPALRFARALRAYGSTSDTRSGPLPSVWELELQDARLVVALSPEVSRGFSGEGGVLTALADDATADDADLVSALLAYDPRIDVGELARGAALPEQRVVQALVRLGAAGRVGYDTAEAAWFHRELPYDPASLGAMHPRLRDAQDLVAAGAVRIDGDAVRVASGDVEHVVRGERCTCPWWGKHRGTRGPCKHVLAAGMVLRV